MIVSSRCLMVCVVVLLAASVPHCLARCLNDGEEVSPRRHFYYNGTSLPLVIETSDRPSHQLVSRLLRILLSEKLGYSTVKLVGVRESTTFPEPALRRLASARSMVNMEVWIPAGFNMEEWSTKHQLISGGPLGSFGRYGWYMPTAMVFDQWNRSHLIVDHWKTFRVKNLAAAYSLEPRLDLIRRVLTRPDPGGEETYCDIMGREERCEGGVMMTKRCSRLAERCAILLLRYPDVDQEVVLDQIAALDLYVTPAWIGSHLNGFVREHNYAAGAGGGGKTRLGRGEVSPLFLNWVPNDLTASGNYSRVHFPTCSGGGGGSTPAVDCDFEVNQLTKVMWARMKTHAPEAFHLVSHLHLAQADLEALLRAYTHLADQASGGGEGLDVDDGALEAAACDWVRRNEPVWEEWLPEGLASKTPIYLGGMFPLTGPYWRQPAIVEGARMAVEYVNSDPSILSDYELVLLVHDTQCKVDVAMKHFVQYVSNRTHPIAGIVGPACSETAEPIAGVSKHFNTIVISYSAEAVQLTNRAAFPLFFRTIPHILQNGEIYVELFRLYAWHQVALLTEDGGQNYPAFHSFLKDLFLSRSIQVVYDRKMPRQASHDDAVKYLEELKRSESRIVIMTTFEQSARAVICEAHRRGMTAWQGYVWFLPTWFTRQWWDTDRYNAQFGERVPCSTEEMTRAVQGYFSLNTAFLGPKDSRIVGNRTVEQWLAAYVDRLDTHNLEFSPYASYAYDAVLVFALGLHTLLSRDPSALESLHTQHTVQTFMSVLNDTHFSGASGPVQFSGADRTGIINIDQHVGNGSQLVGQFVPDRNASERFHLDQTLVTWMEGVVSTDGRPPPKLCGVEAFRRMLGVECDVAVIVINVICISGFVVIMIIILISIKRKYDAKVRQTRLRMEELGLLPGQHADAIFCLDEWEVPREDVVLNRKLGEGAFGTVYGGEVCLNNAWVAVAVKTLKVGSTADDKLDFLGEAEMMKRFDHKNIVKLLGVCTRGEPAYTIMEFMLHGDLKTFLLSRRQLVNEISRESEDIGPLGLTQMALDVARGLQYLALLKYVHRDLASRNCLVHAEKTVKIGDFGMTRHMYDNDYYKFNKRGMFPVRWMAPESLTEGIFGTFSDIWSYGVLLYEIMTFGSFPYQGLSNRQVLNHVKAGNIISIPRGCSPKLQALLRRCWSFDAPSRPSVDDVIDALVAHPQLVAPCLDAPCAAVALDCTDGLEINLVTAGGATTPGPPPAGAAGGAPPHMRHKNQYQRTPTSRGALSSTSHDEDRSSSVIGPGVGGRAYRLTRGHTRGPIVRLTRLILGAMMGGVGRRAFCWGEAWRPGVIAP